MAAIRTVKLNNGGDALRSREKDQYVHLSFVEMEWSMSEKSATMGTVLMAMDAQPSVSKKKDGNVFQEMSRIASGCAEITKYISKIKHAQMAQNMYSMKKSAIPMLAVVFQLVR